jgi:hypothetical protein
MTVTVNKTVDGQKITVKYDDDAGDARYGDRLVSALREAKNKINAAVLMTAKAMHHLSDHDPSDFNNEFLELLQAYFCLPAPTADKTQTYRDALKRIAECLQTTAPGLRRDGLVFQQISREHLAQGFKGIIIFGPLERLFTYVGGDDRHSFAGVTAAASDVYLMYPLLTSEYHGAVNTIVHECTHKFAHTVDHCYFGNWGLKGQRRAYWFSVATAKTLVVYDVGYWVSTRPEDQTVEAAVQAIRAGIAAKQARDVDSPQVSQALGVLLGEIDVEVQQRMANYLDTDSYRALDTVKALNNADSYSNYIVSMPDTVSR